MHTYTCMTWDNNYIHTYIQYKIVKTYIHTHQRF